VEIDEFDTLRSGTVLRHSLGGVWHRCIFSRHMTLAVSSTRLFVYVKGLPHGRLPSDFGDEEVLVHPSRLTVVDDNYTFPKRHWPCGERQRHLNTPLRKVPFLWLDLLMKLKDWNITTIKELCCVYPDVLYTPTLMSADDEARYFKESLCGEPLVKWVDQLRFRPGEICFLHIWLQDLGHDFAREQTADFYRPIRDTYLNGAGQYLGNLSLLAYQCPDFQRRISIRNQHKHQNSTLYTRGYQPSLENFTELETKTVILLPGYKESEVSQSTVSQQATSPVKCEADEVVLPQESGARAGVQSEPVDVDDHVIHVDPSQVETICETGGDKVDPTRIQHCRRVGLVFVETCPLRVVAQVSDDKDNRLINLLQKNDDGSTVVWRENLELLAGLDWPLSKLALVLAEAGIMAHEFTVLGRAKEEEK
jgi:hypothetical protein